MGEVSKWKRGDGEAGEGGGAGGLYEKIFPVDTYKYTNVVNLEA